MPAQLQVFHYLNSSQVTLSSITLSDPPVLRDVAPNLTQLRLMISENLNRIYPSLGQITPADTFLTLIRVKILSTISLPEPDLSNVTNYRIAYPTLQALKRAHPTRHTFTHIPQYSNENRRALTAYLAVQSHQNTALMNAITVFQDQLEFSGFNRSTRLTDSLRTIFSHCLQLNVRNPQATSRQAPSSDADTASAYSSCNLVTRQGPLNLLVVPSLDLFVFTEPQTFRQWLPARIELQTNTKLQPIEILSKFNSEMRRIIPGCITAFPALNNQPPSSEEILLFLVTIAARSHPEYFEAFPFKETLHQEDRPLAVLLAHSTHLDLPMTLWLASPHCPPITLHSREVPLMITLACMALTTAAIFEQNREHSLLNSIPLYYISKFIDPQLCERYQSILRFQHQCDRTGTGSAAFRMFTLMCSIFEAENHEAPDHLDQHGTISHFLMSDTRNGLLDLLHPDPSSR